MRKGWQTVPLKDLCENFKSDIVDGPFGSNLKREHYKESGIPVLKIQNIKPFEIVQKKMDYVDEAKAEELERHNYKNGDIIITKLGLPLGISAIVEDIEDGVIVADLVRVRANKVNTEYLCYHLNSPVTSAFLNEQQGGATRPRVRITAVRELPINVPPLAEQERIVFILDEAFEGIDKAIAQTEQNLASARELFESYLNNIFTQKEDDWVENKLGDVLKTSSGGTPTRSKKEYHEGGTIPWLLSGEVAQGNVYKAKNFITEEGLKNSSAKLFPPQTVLVAMYGATAGQVGILKFESTTNQAVCGIFPSEEYIPEFLYYSILQQQKDLIRASVGNAQPNISQAKIKDISIPLPPLHEQEQIVSSLLKLKSRTSRLQVLYTQKLNDLKELKQSLLKQAFAGELTKEDAA
jgi:type I restriction enzyme S subunit